MGIEEELFRLFNYINVSGSGKKMDPAGINQLFASMLRDMEVNLLRQMRQQIDSMIHERESIHKDAWKTEGIPYGSTTDYGELDPFKILGVDINASREDIEKAYKKKAKTAHPDKGGSHEDMVKVNAAYKAIRIFKGWEK